MQRAFIHVLKSATLGKSLARQILPYQIRAVNDFLYTLLDQQQLYFNTMEARI